MFQPNHPAGISDVSPSHRCMECGAGLMPDEIALYRKLFSRGATEFMCLDCQASYLNVTREKLQEIIDMYHKTGSCSLFAKY